MKKIKQMLMTIAVLLCSATVHAYDFEVDGIYYNIVSLTDLTVSVTSGDSKYSGEVIIPSTVTYKSKDLTVTAIGNQTFYDCQNLTSIILPESVTEIGSQAFYRCKSLTAITLSKSVTEIGYSAFAGCSSLTTINIPEDSKLTKICFNAFASCVSLTTIILPESITKIEYEAFEGCSSLTAINIPENVSEIGFKTFAECSSLKEVIIDNGNEMLSLGANSFDGCPLESVYLGRNLSYAGQSHQTPFYEKETLTTATIGNMVTQITYNTFYGCNLTSIYLMGGTPPSVGSGNFEDVDYMNTIVYVPQGALAVYQMADVWKNFWDMQEHDIPLDPNVETKKCATPTIIYKDGKLNFSSETEGVEFVTEITNSDITKHNTSTIELAVIYNVSTYAKLSGYANSDMAYATLCWIESNDTGADLLQIKSTPVIIKSHEGSISISGVKAGVEIAVYAFVGYKVGTAVADGNEVVINTSLNKNDTAIIYIGDKTIKIVMR